MFVDASARADRALLAIWALFTVTMLVSLTVRALRTARMTAAVRCAPTSRAHTVGRARVLVTARQDPAALDSAALGPAVLGAWRGTIALPAWSRAQLTATQRHLVFAHEAEHVRAGDPRLLTAGMILVALAPWSPAGWWMLGRLRAAVELDCDRRVLARAARHRVTPNASASALTYGTLLLDVAGRLAAAPAAHPRSAPALAGLTPSTLERRIDQMTAPRPPRVRAHVARLAAGALACAAVACEIPRPTGLRAAPAAPLTTVVPGGASPQDVDVTAASVRAVLDARTRAGLATRVGQTRTISIIDSAGRVVATAIANRGDPRPDGGRALLAAGSRATVRMRMFAPGELAADSVAVSWVRFETGSGARTRGQAFQISIAPEPDSAARRMSLDSTLVVIDSRVAGRGHAAIDAIAPSTIDRIEVLKGKMALDQYGEAGRAGVIVVTTKKAVAP